MNKKRLLKLACMTGLLAAAQAQAGAGGAGNTGDLSIQFAFAKSTAASILQSVSETSLFQASGRRAVSDFYDRCRSQMYLGALRTRFELVDSIPDGGSYHALAQRVSGDLIRISRTEMERLAELRQLTAPLLTAVVLHEVGHDCGAEGIVADDSADSLLSDLAESLLRASGSQALVQLIDLDFIGRVEKGEAVRWLDLSARVRAEIAAKYADYVGDWLYLKNRAELGERPAPGSQFYTSPATALIPGWGDSLPATAGAQLRTVVEQLLGATYQSHDFSYRDGSGGLRPLPSSLSCRSGVSSAECRLVVGWAVLGLEGVRSVTPEIEFSLDIFGNLKIRKISIHE